MIIAPHVVPLSSRVTDTFPFAFLGFALNEALSRPPQGRCDTSLLRCTPRLCYEWRALARHRAPVMRLRVTWGGIEFSIEFCLQATTSVSSAMPVTCKHRSGAREGPAAPQAPSTASVRELVVSSALCPNSL